MGIYHARDLDQFVAECDRLGGLGTPETQAFLADFDVRFDTQVDQNLDPFSEEYFRAQVALYSELSGRGLDQNSGELAPLDVDKHVAAVNSYNLRDVKFLSKHTRAVLTCLMLADLPHGATVLDAGCGWGLSSEAMAWCGASVTALDISPNFTELVHRRATRLGLPIEVVRSGFDEYETEKKFDMLFFYECLHHSVKPWETLAHLGKFVKVDGKILFAGEPINANWWKHWGLRLDSGSIYCIRKFGWWESGWSVDFIIQCFARAGFSLVVYQHIGLDNGFVGAALRSDGSLGGRLNLSVMDPMNITSNLLTQARTELSDARLELSVARNKIAALSSPVKTELRRWFRKFKQRCAQAKHLFFS